MSYQISNKIAGSIYGQLIGDALGTRYEFQNGQVVKNRIIIDLNNDGFLPIRGDGPFKLVLGQVTDDSELALGLFHSLLENGRYDKEKVAQKYIKWYNSDPFDIGNATRTAFNGSAGYPKGVRMNFESLYHNICNRSRANTSSLSNGCLMRISPLALYGSTIPDSMLLKYCEEDCRMTNPNPITIDAVRVYCIAIKTAILTKGVKEGKNKIFSRAFATAETPLVKMLLNNSLKGYKPVLLNNGSYCEPDSKAQGYFGIALQNAFYQLMNGTSFYQSLIDTISLGGDTDTNACIAGALLGAYYGVNGIPTKWKTSVNITNPRIGKYPEVDQSNVNNLSTTFVNKFFRT